MDKLEAMLKYVSEHNDFYKRRIAEYGISNPLDITQWPILTRKELQDNRHNMFSDGYKMLYLNSQLIAHSSSGTSGVPVTTFWRANDYYSSLIPLWRFRYNWYGIRPNDKVVSFTLPHIEQLEGSFFEDIGDGLIIKNRLLFNATTISGKEKVSDMLSSINAFNPKWIYIQPSIMRMILDEIGDDYCIPGLRYVEFVGEILDDALKKQTATRFNVSVSNMYGSQENNCIAFECPYGNMHILEENVFVDDSGALTNLNNYAMPLIRYDQGDELIINSKTTCRCGITSNTIERIEGRKNEYFIVGEKKITSYILSEIIKNINNKYNNRISRYSFFYDTNERTLKCILLIIDSSTWRTYITEDVMNALIEATGGSISVSVIHNEEDDYLQLKKCKILNLINKGEFKDYE